MERDKALEMALSQIEKQFGKGSIMRMGEKGEMDIEAIPTGALALDLALGIGGLPRGRVVEIFGPESSGKSTLAMHVVAEAQRNGGICAYIDAEHAMDPVYAKAIGVNIDELLISQPDTGEQALEIADMLIRSGALDVVVIDSVAALTPRAEIEGEMGDTHVGLQARLMSQALRKLTGNLNRTNTICIFINQLREKIGVMFGCFSYGTRVTLADGTQEKIGKIVNQQLPVEVLSYDPDSGRGRAAQGRRTGSTTAHRRVPAVHGGQARRQRARQFACTPNHQIMTPGGWREAQELVVGDRVLQSVPHHLSDFQWEVMLGGLMGDGALSPTRSRPRRPVPLGPRREAGGVRRLEGVAVRQRRRQPIDQREGRGVPRRAAACPSSPSCARRCTSAARRCSATTTSSGSRRCPWPSGTWTTARSRCGPRACRSAREDGSGRSEICVEAMSPDTRERLAGVSRRHLGHPPEADRTRARQGRSRLPEGRDGEAARARSRRSCTRRWSTSCCRGTAAGSRSSRCSPRCATSSCRCRSRRSACSRRRRSMHRFDIEVEGTHNYFVDGVMVHNSPETTPGGRALKFYSSVRLDIRRIESIKDGAEVIGNRTRVKVVKNKVAPPFRQAEFDIMYGKGISREGSLLDVGVDLGIVKKSGAWFTYEGEQLGQGRENAKSFLAENPEIMVEISERVRAGRHPAVRTKLRRVELGRADPERRADHARRLTTLFPRAAPSRRPRG